MMIRRGELDNPFMDVESPEEAIEVVQNAVAGESKGFTEDIPAYHQTDSGRRIINKVQTRRNIHRKLFGDKTFLYPIVILGISLIAVLIFSLL